MATRTPTTRNPAVHASAAFIEWLAVGQAIVTVGYVYSLAVVMD